MYVCSVEISFKIIHFSLLLSYLYILFYRFLFSFNFSIACIHYIKIRCVYCPLTSTLCAITLFSFSFFIKLIRLSAYNALYNLYYRTCIRYIMYPIIPIVDAHVSLLEVGVLSLRSEPIIAFIQF